MSTKRWDQIHTKQSSKVLRSINISNSLILPFVMPNFPLLTGFEILLTLKTIEKEFAEGFVEIFFGSSDHFLQKIGFGRTKTTFAFLLFKIGIQDRVDGMFGW